jgi:GSCFA family
VMLQELRRAKADTAGIDTCLVDAGDDEVVDMQLFAAPPVTRSRGAQRRHEVVTLFQRAFASDIAIVTLGQVEAWWDAAGDQYCNQMPTGRVIDSNPDRFYFRELTLDEIVACVSETCELLCTGDRLARIILTVSPVPISRAWEADDALTGYVHAKSVLRVAAEAVASSFPQVDYFPSYDIVALSDRSVVFAADRMHIRQPVVDHIAERMISSYVTPNVTAGSA